MSRLDLTRQKECSQRYDEPGVCFGVANEFFVVRWLSGVPEDVLEERHAFSQ